MIWEEKGPVQASAVTGNGRPVTFCLRGTLYWQNMFE